MHCATRTELSFEMRLISLFQLQEYLAASISSQIWEEFLVDIVKINSFSKNNELLTN